MTPVIAVTGATGYVGRYVVAALQQAGMSVRALSRPDSNRAGFVTPPDWINGDLLHEPALTALVSGAEAVVHLAYAHLPGRYRGGEGDNLAGWLETNVNGSLRLLMAARTAGVRRFILLSSRAVFSHTEPGRVLDETHPVSPDTHYGAYKVAVEAFLHSFRHVHGMQTCAIRATGVYGLTYPVERSKWWGLVQAVLRDEPLPVGKGGTEVHGADVARTVVALLTQPAIPPTVHLSDLYVTPRDIVRLTRELAARPGPLPDAPLTPPVNVLVSRHLADLGIILGGYPLLEATLREMLP